MRPTTTHPWPSLIVSISSIALAGLLFGLPALADSDTDIPEIKYRQQLMESVGSNMGGIGTILKNQLAMPGHVESHARQLAESSKLIAAAFKKEVSSDDSDAQPEIWKDWSGFESAIADFEKASNDLAAAAASGDGAAVGPAVKALGKSCGGCHKPFRKPKEESYKNK
jgi:cytochrome c556